MITRRSVGRGGTIVLLNLVAVLALALAGCGGSESSAPGDAQIESPPTDADAETVPDETEEEDSAAATGAGTATVEVGGTAYEFSTETGCTVLGDLVTVSMGQYGVENHMSLTRAGDVVLVRVSVDGQDWEQASPTPDPEVSGSTATWTGEIIADGSGATETATIVAMC